jgi:uncharacterized membrane protein YoaK (UPF0700 family)
VRLGGSRWPAWMVALAISVGGGILCVLFYFVIPELGFHGLPAGEGSVRLLAPLTLFFAAICYASFADDKPRRSARLHLASAGIVGGTACVFVLHALPLATPISVPVVALGAVIGAVLAVAGVFGFVARGL